MVGVRNARLVQGLALLGPRRFGVLLNGMGAKHHHIFGSHVLVSFGVLLNGRGAKHDDLQFESA